MKQIPLTQGQFALVDNEDFEELSKYKWYAQWEPHGQTYYAGRHLKNPSTTFTMHRQVMGASPEQRIDHRDHNGLNNQKENLRLCTDVQNQRNQRKLKNKSSRFKGVCRNRYGGWRVYIVVNYKQKHLGHFVNEIDAALAYNKAATELFGEYALLNALC